jgi:CRISPR-associated protein Cas2
MAHREIRHQRKLYLCTYDITQDKRRTQLFDLLKDHGEHVQYSVFLCELTKTEQRRLIALSDEILHANEDQLLVLDIGPPSLNWVDKLDCVGKSWHPAIRSHII